MSAIGVGTAWLVTMCQFPGRGIFEWALLLPIAVPTYIIGYIYTDLLQFVGPVQTLLRDMMGWTRRDYWFPPVRSLGGAVAVMTLVLYPYVYLLARASFLEQCICMIDVSRTLGRGPWGSFFEVAVPLARPAIVGGVALVLMEVLADFGTVQYFGVNTFTTGIYRTWFAIGEPVAAAQLAAVLMPLVLSLLLVERWSRGLARYHHTAQSRPRPSYRLRGTCAALALVACAAPVALGFSLPVAVLAKMALGQGDALLGGLFWRSPPTASASPRSRGADGGAGARRRLRPAAAPVAGDAGLRPGRVARLRDAGLGDRGRRADPVRPLRQRGRRLDAVDHFGVSTGLLITGTIGALVFAYLVRFLALAFNTVEARLGKINRNLDDASRILGRGPRRHAGPGPRAADVGQRADGGDAGVRRRDQGTAGDDDRPALQLRHPRGPDLSLRRRRAARRGLDRCARDRRRRHHPGDPVEPRDRALAPGPRTHLDNTERLEPGITGVTSRSAGRALAGERQAVADRHAARG